MRASQATSAMAPACHHRHPTLQVGGWPTLQAATSPRDTDQDGLPDYWEQAVGLNPLSQDNNGDANGDGCTNLEDYLNWLAGPHAVCNRDASAEVNLRTLNGGASALTFTVANGLNGIGNLLPRPTRRNSSRSPTSRAGPASTTRQRILRTTPPSPGRRSRCSSLAPTRRPSSRGHR